MTSEIRKEWHWLKDLLDAIEKIESHPQFINGKSAFDTDEHYRVWVFYHMERIGECASRLRKEFGYDTKHPEMDWHGTVVMRRHLVHVYWKANPDLVWNGVLYLTEAKRTLRSILDELDVASSKIPQTNEGPPFPEPKNSLQVLANQAYLEKKDSDHSSVAPQ